MARVYVYINKKEPDFVIHLEKTKACGNMFKNYKNKTPMGNIEWINDEVFKMVKTDNGFWLSCFIPNNILCSSSKKDIKNYIFNLVLKNKDNIELSMNEIKRLKKKKKICKVCKN